MKPFHTMTFLTAAALLTGALLLFAGCEKEKKQKEETHNPLCGTTWVEYGYSHYTIIHDSDNYKITESEYYKDTLCFLTDIEVLLKTTGGATVLSNYQIIEDSLLYFSHIGGPRRLHYWRLLNNNHLLLGNWEHQFDITGSIVNIYLKRIDYEN
jgi:hypothetical protein